MAGHALIYGDVCLLSDKSAAGGAPLLIPAAVCTRASDIGQYKFWGRSSARLILSHPRAVSFDKGDTQYDMVAGALYSDTGDIFTHTRHVHSLSGARGPF